ncbi:aldehyde dehydrogenase family protein [Microbacterium kribbense]|uniref:Aldehyde dehydrogenase family protein n=1 Tax=Microbacterium kribbense TaxID=433645 RepID=A0ABP7FXX1_9MICO
MTTPATSPTPPAKKSRGSAPAAAQPETEARTAASTKADSQATAKPETAAKPTPAAKPKAAPSKASATAAKAAPRKASATKPKALPKAAPKPMAAAKAAPPATSKAAPSKASATATAAKPETAETTAPKRKTTPKPRVAEAAATEPADTLPDAIREPLDAAIAQVQDGARAWSSLTGEQRIRLLERVRAAVVASAEEWAITAARSKGLNESHPLVGEEWLSGPYSLLGALDGYIATLRTLAAGKSPLDGVRTDLVPGRRLRAHVFPATRMDSLLLSGFTGEVWMQPGYTLAEARLEAGLGQRDRSARATAGLVLGAGNITSIPLLDVLYELLAANRVSVLKVGPTQDDLVPVYERVLAPLIEPGFLRIVRGGGDVGAYLTRHPAFEHIHITGSTTTFDAIVWGTGVEATRRKKADDPKLTVPITAELGGVAPIIVVPGEWTDDDLAYQASHIATMRLHNSGHNCIAGQVVIVGADWPQREAFLAALRSAYTAAPRRPVWYPRSDEKLARARADYPDAAWSADGTRALIDIGAGADATALETTEYFAPVLGVVELAGNGQEFLDAAVAHANEKLAGTLGANVLIDPATEAVLGDGFDRAIAELRYGGIAINGWTGVLFATPILSWGAYPGATVQDVASGVGVVHNSLLLAGVERSVLRGPFRPFPRSLGGKNRFSVLPKPPWFVDSRTSTLVAEGLTRWYMDHSVPRLLATLTRAMRS